jgi:hypothetical protein
MDKTFAYQSQIKNIQNNLLTQNIKESSNLSALNSEEAIRNVITSYIDKFKELGNSLIDITKFVVESKELIRVKDFNDLFEGIYIDLYALYSDIGEVSKVLDINLQRNKNYFLVVKKRIRDLWNKLNLIRTYIHDENPADESFYESFSTDINSSYISLCEVDKKNGYLFLNPLKSEIQNKSTQIKNVTSIIYPEPNDNGGVFTTTDVLNTYEENYTNGPRDMLQNGLWKEEILTNEVPSMLVNIGTVSGKILRNYRGIVGIIDIEYTSPIEFNRIDFDVYGDRPTLIDAILYKDKYDDDWNVVNFLPEDSLMVSGYTQENKKYSARGEGFDIITFYNTEKIKTRFLRVVVNQENYIILSKSAKTNITVEEKINQDLSERRYEVIKFDSSIDGFLTKPTNSENRSLYDKIMDIIESTSSIEKILKNIQELLLPQVKVVKLNFSDTYKFEMGLWSIEPKLEFYNYTKAKYFSNLTTLNERSLISASISVKQQVPLSTTCNWYYDIDDKSIPVIENASRFRKEPINQYNMVNYSVFSDWTKGCFVKLDFPIDPLLSQNLIIYENGNINNQIDTKIAFLNSSLIFLHDIKNPFYNNYVLRYPAALYDTVNLYALVPKVNITTDNNLLQLGIVSSNREIFNAFISNVKYINTGIYISDDFNIINILATKIEAISWFGENFNNCISISSKIIDRLELDEEYERFLPVINVVVTKLSSTFQDALNFYIGQIGSGPSFNLIGTFSNIVSFSNIRSI